MASRYKKAAIRSALLELSDIKKCDKDKEMTCWMESCPIRGKVSAEDLDRYAGDFCRLASLSSRPLREDMILGDGNRRLSHHVR
jgi:hypothetical protein